MRARWPLIAARRDQRTADTSQARRSDRRPADWDVHLVVAAGGALGGVARWALATAWRTPPHGIGWVTLLTNAIGSFLIGGLTVWLAETRPPGRFLRPFLGVGVLGGFTTFSTYVVHTRGLMEAGQTALAFCYAVGGLAAGLFAVSIGVVGARLLAGRPVRRGPLALVPYTGPASPGDGSAQGPTLGTARP